MRPCFFVLILICSLTLAVSAAPSWNGVSDPASAAAAVRQHNNSFTELEFTFSGLYSEFTEGEYTYSFDGNIFGDHPSFTKMIAIPAFKDVRVELVDLKYEELNLDVPVFFNDEVVKIGRPGIMRDLRIVPVTIYPLRETSAGTVEILKRARIKLHYEGHSDVNNVVFNGPTSSAFENVYQRTVLNYQWLDGGAEPFGKGTYLIVISELFAANSQFEEWANWKRMKGYNVVVYHQPASMTYNQLNNVIRDYYLNSTPPLEYVILIGDVNSSQGNIPADLIPHPYGVEIDVTDHPYTMQAGDDFFSDFFIGRISVSTSIEARLVYTKMLNYEKTPYLLETDWYSAALIVAGNFNDNGPAPITPCQTGWWIADEFIEHGYTDVDTVFYWGPGDLNPGNADEINGFINTGRGFVVYRGWADANGWQYPYYNISHLEGLSNNWKLPVVLSFVCNTGDYGSTSPSPCFGEAFVRHGNFNNGNGAIAFLGPSDLDTNTKYNNAIATGMVQGFLDLGLGHFAAATEYGKMTLYEGYPVDDDGFVPFYFHVYNCLGDPELEMWNLHPVEMEIETPASVPKGTSSMDVYVREAGLPLEGAYVTVLRDDDLLAGDYTNAAGKVMLAYDPLIYGELIVTATKYKYVPVIDTIPMVIWNYVGYYEDELIAETTPDGKLNPGETATLRLTVKNYGHNPKTNLSVELSTYNPFLTSITPAAVTVGTLEPFETADADFEIVLDDNALSGTVVEFKVKINGDNSCDNSKFELVIDGSDLAIAEVSNLILTPGQQEQIQFQIVNNGDFTASDVSISLHSFDGAVSVIAGQADIGNIAPGQITNYSDPLTVQVEGDAFIGREIMMRLEMIPAVGGVQLEEFIFIAGNPDTTDPGGPDPYGYFAYDDGDTDYAPAPVYDWIELDPSHGGSGQATRFYMGDDSSTAIDLPFDFTFYGETYDELTICTNGWVSMMPTWQSNFRNWDLPSPPGPSNMICPFWDDLVDVADSLLDIYYWHDAANGKVIVEWSRVQNRFENTPDRMETFELILFDPAVQSGPTGDGDILCQYMEINDVDFNNNYSTVGLQDADHLIGLEYVFTKNYQVHPTSHVLHDEMAILFTTTPPDQYSAVAEVPDYIPQNYSMAPNYPNPFNNSTKVSFEIAQKGFTELKVFDVNGRLINTLHAGSLSPGKYNRSWNGDDKNGSAVSSGVYFIQLKSGEYQHSIKTILLK